MAVKEISIFPSSRLSEVGFGYGEADEVELGLRTDKAVNENGLLGMQGHSELTPGMTGHTQSGMTPLGWGCIRHRTHSSWLGLDSRAQGRKPRVPCG